MQHFARKFLTPLCAAGLALSTLHGPAQAETSTAAQAMMFLSKSAAVDSKCNFLSAEDHATLSGLVARAELSLAQSATAPVASAALAKGRSLGKSTLCNAASRTETMDILNAANAAVSQASAQTPITQPQAAPAAKPKPQIIKAKILAVAKSGKLATYAELTQKYYFARRCGGMRPQSINALYQDVVALHIQTLQRYSRSAVAAAMHHSEAQANAQSCG